MQTIAASTVLVPGGLIRGVEANYSKVRIGARALKVKVDPRTRVRRSAQLSSR